MITTSSMGVTCTELVENYDCFYNMVILRDVHTKTNLDRARGSRSRPMLSILPLWWSPFPPQNNPCNRILLLLLLLVIIRCNDGKGGRILAVAIISIMIIIQVTMCIERMVFVFDIRKAGWTDGS